MNTFVPCFTNMAVAASKYVQKYSKSPKVASKDEFFVGTTNIISVTQYKEKIEKMYDIKILLEETKSDEGQWLILEGESVDRRNAKNYINAICNPAERKQVQFPTSSCSELTDPATLEHIEKQTNAFIRPLKKIAQFEISGTELAVTLAFSQIEELAGSAVEGEEQFDDCEDTDDGQSDGIIKISPATHNGSSRLNSILERALSANSDGICSVEDYRHTRPSVQRVLVSCLQNEDDIDDDMLFDDGKVADSTPKGSNLMMYFENSGDDKPHSSIEVDGETQIVTKEQTSPGVGAFTDKITELSIGKSKEPSSLLTKQQEYLRNFGLTVGFKEKDVDTAINFVNEKTRPSDFLDLLNNLPKDDDNDASEHHESTANISRDSGDDVVILSTETVDLVSGETTVVHETNNSINVPGKTDATNRLNQASNGSLPDWYKERLLQDFMSEDENCSVEELKKRNAERQRLLRENFEKQINQPDGQTKGKSKNRNKNRNKKKKKQQNQQQQQSEADNVDNSEKREKQFRIDVGENESRTYSSDGEQTCVLRVWSADQDLSNAGSGPNKACAGPSGAEVVQTTPKRKNCNGRNNNQQQIPPLLPGLGNFNQQQNFSNGAGPAGNQWSQVKGQNEPQGRGQGYGQYVGPIGRGFHVKPTQVVTPSPVNLAQGNNAGMLAPGSAASKPVELRYIVIDGSNVAMTHGNGKYFSCKGIKLCVDYFRQRGHENITVFVPQWRQYRPSDDNPILDQNILHELKQEDILVFTPSRRIGRKLVVAYDDRFVLELAEAEDAIIVSNDQYRDLMMEKVAWRKIIETRLLMYSFVKDRFMPPNDPLGREGPCLDEFLQVTKKSYNVNRRQYNGYNQQKQPQQHYHQQQQHQYHQPQQQQQYQQPQGHGIFHQGQDQQNQGHFNQGQGHYAKAARYGLNKQENNSSTPNKSGNRFKPLSQQPNDPQQFDEADGNFPRTPQSKGQWKNAPKGQGQGPLKNRGAPRSEEETEDLYKELKILFPEEEQEEKIRSILINHNSERDLMKLTNYLMSVLFDV